ncbi:MAG: hypothetical protein M3Y41_10420 [Pseudomonadota bacterium]|nr:hypothetical protein [Pseudomonadota bacterium]
MASATAEIIHYGISRGNEPLRAVQSNLCRRGPWTMRAKDSALAVAAAALALRLPVLTARGLAGELRLSHQAALGLLNQPVAAGVRREATGRAGLRRDLTCAAAAREFRRALCPITSQPSAGRQKEAI